MRYRGTTTHPRATGFAGTEGVDTVLKFSANKYAGTSTKTYAGEARKKTFHSVQRQT